MNVSEVERIRRVLLSLLGHNRGVLERSCVIRREAIHGVRCQALERLSDSYV